METMTRLAYAVAPLVLGQLTLACNAGDPALEGDSGAGDSFSSGDSFSPGDPFSSGDPIDVGDGILCPPSGGFGFDEGTVLPNATLRDCDGNTVRFDELCAREAAWIFIFAGW